MPILSKLWIGVVFLFAGQLGARENFQFNIGDQVTVFADHSYHIQSQNYLKAQGNVIITHKTDTLYGEMASFDKNKGDIQVEGNVRYVSPEMTLYGGRLNYNLVTQAMSIHDARITSPLYTVVGKKIERESPNVYLAEEAEYSTCKNCPSSWSVYGKKVRITAGEYIHVNHALIKVNGVVILYLPYIVIPIKKERQTGLLFPEFSMNFSEGFFFEQPWFWAISPHADMTLSPAVWGDRGLGFEAQYRQVLGESKWFQLDSMVSHDRLYLPTKTDLNPSGTHYARNFTRYEHHYEWGQHLTHHFRFHGTRDLDFFRDFRRYTQNEVTGSEVSSEGFVDLRTSLFNFSFESQYAQNALVSNPTLFDDSYVQILPRIKTSLKPITLWRSSIPFLQKTMIGLDTEYTHFKQNHFLETTDFRNAHRLMVNPYVDWHFLQGPLKLKTKWTYDSQYYDFVKEGAENAKKNASLFLTEFSFELDKIYGLAYVEKIAVQDTQVSKTEQNMRETNTMIAKAPLFGEEIERDFKEKIHESYRHSQEIKLRHHYTASQSYHGNNQFRTQISRSQGLFDYWDSIRVEQNTFGTNESLKEISPGNTMELQWNNTLIRKTPRNFNPFQDGRYLNNNFDYNKIAYFNVSQGVELSTDRATFADDLTRLLITTGFNVASWSFTASETYFHQTGKNITDFSIDKRLSALSLGATLFLNSLTVPRTQNLLFRSFFSPFETLGFSFNSYYDLAIEKFISNDYGLIYTPSSDCWKLSLNYIKTVVDNRFLFNFMLNFSGEGFTGVGAK
ncbi:MAG: LPS-assembly protein LptD [Bacteriovoracaceae bacterium]|nr:LPS-assembly protein LptD [Bacteriovoracaceae bacterium]